MTGGIHTHERARDAAAPQLAVVCDATHGALNRELASIDGRLRRIEIALWSIAIAFAGGAFTIIATKVAWAWGG